MAKRSQILLHALRAVASDAELAGATVADSFEVETIIASGLGPLLYALLKRGGAELPDIARPLQAAYLTSKVLSADLRDGVAYTLDALDAHGIEATLLKGISFATRYYAEPHLRVMGDVDLLLRAEQVDSGISALLEAGFIVPEPPPSIDFATHIHAPGMFHPERELWIELHRRLILPSFAASAETPLNLADVERHQRTGKFAGQHVKYMSPEFELVYLAVGWCRDLTDGGIRAPGLRRMLFDAAVLIHTADSLDWDSVQRWSRNSLTGTCVYVLLSYLAKHEAVPNIDALLADIRANQSYVNKVSLRLAHRVFDRYLLGLRPFGPLCSPNTLSNVFDALIAPRPAWQNLAAAPANVIFPRREPRRFSWRYQLDRLGSVLGKR